MKIIEEFIENINMKEELSIALGTFDGIHRGHRKLIEQAVSMSKEMNIKSAVLTFDIHPLKLLKPELNIKIITDNYVKAKIIESLGIDYLFFVKFNEEFANLDENEFINILKSKFNSKALVCGYNYTFGKYGKGNINTLDSNKDKLNYKLSVLSKITYENHNISSSVIRHKIEAGSISEANILLGYNYLIIGKVIKGKQLGRVLGFPTANIEISDDICLKNGVYVSLAKIDGKQYPGVSSVGKNPTVGDAKRMFETHIFNFNEDIYGKEINVELLHFIRGEVKFNSIVELKNRVFIDMDVARAFFSSNDIYNV